MTITELLSFLLKKKTQKTLKKGCHIPIIVNDKNIGKIKRKKKNK